MKATDILTVLGDMDDELIFESEIMGKKRPKRWIKAAGIVAACLVLAVTLSLTWFSIADALEYQAALSFFEENGLSTEGLSRYDIKAVYHDIITKSFTYGKTASVLRNSASVSGLELELPDEDSSVVSGEPSEKYNNSPDDDGNGIVMRADNQDIFNDEGAKISQKSIVSCYKDDELLWTKEIPDTHILIDSYLYTDNGFVFYGVNTVWSSIYDNTTKYYIGFIDNEGSFEWSIAPDHGFQYAITAFSMKISRLYSITVTELLLSSVKEIMIIFVSACMMKTVTRRA